MKSEVKVLKVNAFTDRIDGGNPAGVYLDSSILSDKQMTEVSKLLKVSETAFVYPSDNAEYKVRFFSPKVEVALCGHATIATFFTMCLKGLIKNKENRVCVKQETKAGILPVYLYFKNELIKKVMMEQSNLVLKDVDYDISKISEALNIDADEIDTYLPLQKVSTGLFTLPICISNFDTLKDMKPDFDKVKKVCSKIDVGSFHVFTFDTIENDSLYHARCFAPVYGINEDPVTGTANGAVCSYLVKNNIVEGNKFICEQGDTIGRRGRLNVNIEEGKTLVGGEAKIVEEVILNF